MEDGPLMICPSDSLVYRGLGDKTYAPDQVFSTQNIIMRSGGNLLNFILNQLSDLEGITFRKTFDGIQFLSGDVIFGRIRAGKFILQASSTCGANPNIEVEIQKNGREVYLCEVPEPVLEDKNKLQKVIKKILKKA